MEENEIKGENKFFSGILQIIKMERNHPDMNKVLNLYNNSFPENELVDFQEFFSSRIISDVLSFYDNNQFIGFAVLVSYVNISNILYFAIEPNLRGKGYGTQSLKQICQYYQNNKIILDVEDPFECNNEKEREIRLKRISFYKNAGFKLTDIKYNWMNEFYIIMVINSANITENEFRNFWKYWKG